MKIGDTIEHEGKTFWLVQATPGGDSCNACALQKPSGCKIANADIHANTGVTGAVCDAWSEDGTDLIAVGRFVATEVEYLTLRLKGET